VLRAFGLGTILFGFWLALSGHFDSPLLLGFGVGSCVLVVYLSVRMDVVDHEGVPYHVFGRILAYIPWLMKEIFVANVEVARVILSPTPRISPRIVVFHGSQETDLGRVVYANSITLTPGTITTGVEGNEFQIHALRAADLETDEEQQMDIRCTWVEQGRFGPERGRPPMRGDS
jgi:multicomponent Na+:H+ antiporter subunit E